MNKYLWFLVAIVVFSTTALVFNELCYAQPGWVHPSHASRMRWEIIGLIGKNRRLEQELTELLALREELYRNRQELGE